MGDTNLLILFIAILGLCLGSFINVLIYRIPNNISIISPRSFCVNCKSIIPLYRNIPILTYIFQLGKCHRCNQKISIKYPIIESSTSLIYVLFFIYGIEQFDFIELIYSFIVISLLIPMCLIDMEHLYFPSKILFSSIIFSFIYTGLTFWFNNNYNAFLGIICGLTFLIAIYFLTKVFLLNRKNQDPMGFGDILLIIPLGAWLGPVKIILCLFLASLFALIAWIILWLVIGFNFKMRMPFGPYLFLAAIVLKITNLHELIFALIFQIRL